MAYLLEKRRSAPPTPKKKRRIDLRRRAMGVIMTYILEKERSALLAQIRQGV